MPTKRKPIASCNPTLPTFRQRDAAVSVVKTLEPQYRKQRGVERAADPRTAVLCVDVHRHVRGPLVRRARVVGGRVHITRHAARQVAHQPRVSLRRRRDAAGHLRGVGWDHFKRSHAPGDVRRVDRRHGGRVPFLDGSDDGVGRRHVPGNNRSAPRLSSKLSAGRSGGMYGIRLDTDETLRLGEHPASDCLSR